MSLALCPSPAFTRYAPKPNAPALTEASEEERVGREPKKKATPKKRTSKRESERCQTCAAPIDETEALFNRARLRNEREANRILEATRRAVSAGQLALTTEGYATPRARAREVCRDAFHGLVASHIELEAVLIPTERLLAHAFAQAEAIRALGGGLAQIPGSLQDVAIRLLPLMQLAAQGSAPKDAEALVLQILEPARRCLARGDRSELWMLELAREMELHGEAIPPGSADATEGWAEAMLDGLHERLGDEYMPKQLLQVEPSAAGKFPRVKPEFRSSLRKAASVLAGLHVTVNKAGGRGGKRVSPWGAARLFAAEFGLSMPAKPSEKRRPWRKK